MTPPSSREGPRLKLDTLTTTWQVGHNAWPHPGFCSLLPGGGKKKRRGSTPFSALCFKHQPPRSFIRVFPTPRHYKVQKERVWSVTSQCHHWNAPEKGDQKGEVNPTQKHWNRTSLHQGKGNTGPSKAREMQIIMCSIQSRNKHAILNIFQVYFQKI